jgi:hypothetical protein
MAGVVPRSTRSSVDRLGGATAPAFVIVERERRPVEPRELNSVRSI